MNFPVVLLIDKPRAAFLQFVTTNWPRKKKIDSQLKCWSRGGNSLPYEAFHQAVACNFHTVLSLDSVHHASFPSAA